MSDEFSVKFDSHSHIANRVSFTEKIKDFLQILKSANINLYKDACVYVPHGSEVQKNTMTERIEKNPDTFIVYMWGQLPAGYDFSRTMGTYLWDTLVDCRDCHFKSSGLGISIISPEGHDVAEFIAPNTLFIHYDIAHMGYSNEIIILEKILEEVFNIVTKTMENFDKEKYKEELMLRKTEAAVNLILENSIINIEKGLKEYTMFVEDYRKNVVKYSRKIQIAEAELIGLRQDREKSKNALLNSIREIKTFDKVKNIEINNGILSIITDKMYIRTMYRNKDSIFYVGEFSINLNLTDSSVKFKQLDKDCLRKSAWSSKDCHPHVNSAGTPCLGNAAELIIDCFSTLDFEALALVCLSYLESVNLDDSAGKCILNWDLMNEDLTLKRKGFMDLKGDAEWSKCCLEGCEEEYPTSKMKYCEDCGTRMCPDHLTKVDGLEICPKCLEKMKHCENCGETVKEEEQYSCAICEKPICKHCAETSHGEHICEECYNDETNFRTCANCNTKTRIEKLEHCERCGCEICEDCQYTGDEGGTLTCPPCAGAEKVEIVFRESKKLLEDSHKDEVIVEK